MKRGQSFETMMLVISVIVAVAILAILLNILNPLKPIGENAKNVIPTLTRDVNQVGYGMNIKETVFFGEGDRFYRVNAVGTAPIAEDRVKFVCNDVLCGDSPKPLTVTDTSIVVNKDITATVAVCFGNDGFYRVVIGSVTSEVSQKAETECGLT